MRFFLVCLYLCLELYLLISFANTFGFLTLICEIIISGILGFGILASQNEIMFGSLKDITMGKNNMGSFIGRSFFRFISGILLILPGILSDIFGIVFFIVSLLFKASGKREYKQTNATESSDFSDNDIIDVEVVEVDNKKIEN